MTDTPTLLLPDPGSRWVREISNERLRMIIHVHEVAFDGHEWQVTFLSMPDLPLAPHGPLTVPKSYHIKLDDFWRAEMTPIGGRLEDISKPITLAQYKRPMETA